MIMMWLTSMTGYRHTCSREKEIPYFNVNGGISDDQKV